MKNRPQSNIKFVHCRHKDLNGGIKPHGGLTIAYTINDKFKVVGWAAAKCNIKDMYNKHVGRMKSAGRMLSHEYYQECPEIDEKTFIKNAQDGFQEEFA